MRVIVVEGDKSFSRPHTCHYHVEIVHGSIIESMDRSVYVLYKTLSKVLSNNVLIL